MILFKRISLALAAILFILNMTGCNLDKPPANDRGEAVKENPSQSPTVNQEEENTEEKPEPTLPPPDPIMEQISKMTLEEKIGQMLIVGLDGYSLDINTKELIEKHKVGGFIFFANNIQNSKQLLSLLNSMKEENQKNNIPLFLSVDEEGGRVSRMPKEFKDFPTNKAIGNINNEVFSKEIGKIIAEEISSFGFNMNFAPVLDVNSNPKNPVIGNRAFSSKAEIVSKLGVQTMLGIQEADVIPVIKHFPGHGDTTVDSHKGLPTVNNNLERLESLELIPFAEAIKNNADVVMIAHILLPQIDKENPSSMSKAIITDLLRNKLKFDGVVITDDMTMGAIMKNYNIGEAAVKAVNAGTDIVLVCHEYEKEVEVINALKNAVKVGSISELQINDSVYRILKLKEKYRLKDEVISDIDVDKINNKINKLLKTYMN
jgi:beta-N-acetylhexosaminidase